MIYYFVYISLSLASFSISPPYATLEECKEAVSQVEETVTASTCYALPVPEYIQGALWDQEDGWNLLAGMPRDARNILWNLRRGGQEMGAAR